MNTTASSISSSLSVAPYQLNMWFGSILLGMGNLGCAGNIIVFQSRLYRKRAYSIYLSAEAISDLLYFNFVLLTRVLQKGFQIPITTRFDTLCRIRQFLTFWSNQVSFTFFSFATIDRLLSAQRSNAYRQWSNRVSLAYKMCVINIVVWTLFIGHRLILYSTTNGKCGPPAGDYSYFDNYSEVITAGICPTVVMFVLAYLLIRSVRSVSQRQIGPGTNLQTINARNRTALQNMDSQLTLMLILQSIIATITFIPYSTELIYINVTQTWKKSALRLAQEKVFTELTHLLAYTFFATSFYVSLISNSGFRRELRSFFRKPQNDGSAFQMNTTLNGNTTTMIRPK